MRVDVLDATLVELPDKAAFRQWYPFFATLAPRCAL